MRLKQLCSTGSPARRRGRVPSRQPLPSLPPFLVCALALALAAPRVHAQPAAAGDEHSAALITGQVAASPGQAGDPWVWGENRDGQLGTGDTDDRFTPVPAVRDGDWDALAAGAGHTVGLRGGRLFAWGDNRAGQLGLGMEVDAVNSPLQVGADGDWTAVAAGGFHTLAVKADGSLWAAGSNVAGQLGDGTLNSTRTLEFVSAGPYKAVAAGGNHSLAIHEDGTLWGWGSNFQGAVGSGGAAREMLSPEQVGTASDWIAVAAGANHSLGVRGPDDGTGGTLWAWGRNLEGQLGVGPSLVNEFTPRQAGSADDWVLIEGGGKHSLGVRADGGLWSWGSNAFGQLGLGETTGAREPTAVTAGALDAAVVALAAGRDHSLVIDGAGKAFTAGRNQRSQLGLRDFFASSSNTFLEVEFPGVFDEPDFSVRNVTIGVEDDELRVGDQILVTGQVFNGGADYTAGAEALTVQVFLQRVDDPAVRIPLTRSVGDVEEDAIVVIEGDIARGGATGFQDTFTVPDVTLGQEGDYFVRFEVDPGGVFTEVRKDNNATLSAASFQLLSPPDFSITDVVIDADPGEIRPSGRVEITVTLANSQGTHPSRGRTVDIDVVLTRDDRLGDADDIFVGRLFFGGEVPSQSQVLVSGTEFFPSQIPLAEDYRVAFIIDADGDIDEADRTNNTFITQEGEPFAFFPDLAVIASTPPPNVVRLVPGADIPIDVTVRNRGASYEDGQFEVDLQVVLTVDDVVGNEDDVAVGAFTFTDGFFSGEEEFIGGTLALPDTLPSDDFFLGYEVNRGAVFPGEVSLANNTFVDEDVVYNVRPDFVLTDFIVPDVPVTPGAGIALKADVINGGGQFAAAGRQVSVFVNLTQDGTFGGAGSLPLTNSIDNGEDLDSGGTFSKSARFIVPAAVTAGSYQFVAKVDGGNGGDGTIDEQDESNNEFLAARTVDLLADLRAVEVATAAGTYARGQQVPINALTVTNISPYLVAEGTGLVVEVRLTRDRVFGNFDDVVLVPGTAVPVPAGFAGGAPLAVPIAGAPVPDLTPEGVYRLAARVSFAAPGGGSPTLADADTNNNTTFSGLDVTVTASGLGAALEDHLPDAADPGAPALGEKRGFETVLGGVSSWFAQDDEVENGSAGQSGAVGDGGQSFFEVTVFESRQFQLSFFWKVSSEENFDFLAFSINGVEQASISGDVGTFQEETFSLEPGIYTFNWNYRKDGSFQDGADTGWVDSVTLRTPPPEDFLPDFEVTGLVVGGGAERFTLGETATFVLNLRNSGSQYDPATSAPVPVSVFLVREGEVVGDALATVVSDRPVARGQSLALDGSFTVPADTAVGVYNFLAVADGDAAVAESNEDNNSTSTGDVSVAAAPEFKLSAASVRFPPPAGSGLTAGEVRPEAPVALSVVVFNTLGEHPADAGDVPVEARLTLDSKIGNADDIVVGRFPLSGGIASGGSIALDFTTTLPGTIPRNAYRFGFRINPERSINEADFTNNDILTDPVQFLPDLQIDVTSATLVDATQLLPGGDFNLGLTVSNQGADFRQNAAEVTVEAVLTEDDLIGAEDLPLATFSFVDGLLFGAALELETVIQLPSSIPSAAYRVGFRVNGNGALPEVTADNNDRVDISVFNVAPDLLIAEGGLTIPPAEVVPGGNLTIKVTGLNRGGSFTFGADPVEVALRLTRNSVVGDGDDVVLGGRISHSADLDSGQSFSQSLSFDVPAVIPVGSYFFAARIDDGELINEQDETNNVEFSEAPVDLFADLSADGVEYTAGEYARGETIPVSEARFSNANPYLVPEGAEVALSVLLSKDRVFGNTDDVVVSEQIINVPANFVAGGASVAQALAGITVPPFAPAGDYFFGLQVGFPAASGGAGSLIDARANNDVLFSALADVRITGDSLADALEDHLPAPADPANPGFGERQGLQPLLLGDSSWFAQSDVVQEGAAGQSGPVGDGGASTFLLRLFADERFTLSFFWGVSSEESFDFLTFSINGEAVGAISGEVPYEEFTAALEPGAYTLRWTYSKDSGATSGQDAGYVDSITLRAPSADDFLPDFQISAVTVGGGSDRLTIGQTAEVTASLLNAGGQFIPGAEPVSIAVFLSTDGDLGDPDDLLLGSLQTARPVGRGRSIAVSGNIVIPAEITEGVYRFVLVADSGEVVTEADETNNTTAGGEVTVATAPDFLINTPQVVFTGRFFSTTDNDRPGLPLPNVLSDITVTVDNLKGNHPDGSPDVPVEVRLTLDEELGPDEGDDIVVGRFDLSEGIASGGSIALGVEDLRLPREIPAGDYRFGLWINPDGDTNETDFSNNMSFTDPFPFRTDLEIDFFTTQFFRNNTFRPGEEISFSLTVNNDGAAFVGSAANPVLIDIVLSEDGAVDAGDILVAQLELTEGLAFGERESFFGEDVVLPEQIPSGSYRLGVLVNSNRVFEETTRVNNQRVDDDGFEISPDFVVTKFNVPDAAVTPGASLGFKIDFTNQGGQFLALAEPIAATVRLTQNDAFGDDDDIVLAGALEHAGGLNFGDVVGGSLAFQVPGTVPVGTYRYAVKVDSGNLVTEEDEVNNLVIDPGELELFADLSPSALNYTAGAYAPGDAFPLGDLNFTNSQPYLVPAGAALRAEVHLTRDGVFGNTDDVEVLDTTIPAPADFSGGGAFAETLSGASVPASAPAGIYRVAVRVSFPAPADGSAGLVDADPGNDILFLAAADVTVSGDDFGEALEDGFALARGLDPVLGGDSSWFAQRDVVSPGGGAAAGQSGPVDDNGVSFFEIEVTENRIFALNFMWKVDSEPGFDFLTFSVDGTPAGAISGNVDWTPVSTLFDPGSYSFRWTYSKDGSGESVNDAGWVDEIEVDTDAVDKPDLVLRSLDPDGDSFVAGDRMPVTIVAANQGAPLPGGVNFAPADISARLSVDRVFGNGDDILLGSVGRVERNEAGDQIIFSGDLPLPLAIAAGSYFVAAYIDFNDRLEEFQLPGYVQYTATDNNLLFTETAITIRQLPDLEVDAASVSFANGRLLYPGNTLPLAFTVRNRGVASISQGEPWTVQVSLRRLAVGADIGTAAAAGTVAEFPVARFAPGVDALNPDGGSLQFQTEVTLPAEGLLGALVDSEFVFAIEVDAGGEIEELNEDNTAVVDRRFSIRSLGAPVTDFAGWSAFFGGSLNAGDDTDGDGLSNLQEYAIGTDPLTADANAAGLFGSFGIELVDGVEYLAASFDFNNLATDLVYAVEVSGDNVVFTPIQTVEPPFDQAHGPRSLTGVNGLSSEATVLSVSPRGPAVRVSIRDVVPASGPGAPAQRFIRLRVELD